MPQEMTGSQKRKAKYLLPLPRVAGATELTRHGARLADAAHAQTHVRFEDEHATPQLPGCHGNQQRSCGSTFSKTRRTCSFEKKREKEILCACWRATHVRFTQHLQGAELHEALYGALQHCARALALLTHLRSTPDSSTSSSFLSAIVRY